MKVIQLSKNNIAEYREYLTPDIAEMALRAFSHGLIVLDNDIPSASILWRQQNIMSHDPCESHIISFRAGNEEANDLLFSEYKKHMEDEDVALSVVELTARDHAPEKEALKKAGFKVSLMEDDTIKVKLSALKMLPFFVKITRQPFIHPLMDMSAKQYNETVRKMLFKNKYGLCEDIAFLPRSYFDEEVSCYCEIQDEIVGVFLVHRTPSGGIKPELMTSWTEDSKKYIPVLITHSLLFAAEIYDPGDMVILDRHNIQSLALVEKFFPDRIGVPIFIGMRAEKTVAKDRSLELFEEFLRTSDGLF